MRYLIVDGHSMIFAWPDLTRLHAHNNEAARNELVRRMARFQDAGDERVVVVFDGQGSKVESQLVDEGIQVVYSKSGQTADSVIERLTANYAASNEIRVATSDRMEQMTVSTFGATTISAESLADEMAAAENSLAERIRKHNSRR